MSIPHLGFNGVEGVIVALAVDEFFVPPSAKMPQQSITR